MQFAVLFALVALVCAQQNSFRPGGQNNIQCGFSCTRRASFVANIDGQTTTATCTANGVNPRDRCDACCKSRALAAGLQATQASGFPSSNNQDCVCCTDNNRCRK